MNTFLRLDDYIAPGYGLQVTGDMEIRTADLSGETSATARVDQGVKPKTLSVSLTVPYVEQESLRKLVRIAEARDADGSLHIYRVANATANVAGVRQARFTDHVRWREMEGAAAWAVTFTLREHASAPERVEQREAAKTATAQTSRGATVTSGEGASDGSFQNVLRYIEKELR